MLTESISKQLVDNDLDVLRVSVYSVRDDRMKDVTGSNLKPDIIFDNLLKLKLYRDGKKKSFPKIYAKMLDSNSSENDEFIDLYKNVADEVGIDEVFQINLGDGVDVYKNMYKGDFKIAHEKSLNSNDVDFTSRRPCRYPFTHITIRNDGSVIVCCADWLKELRIGNILEHTLEEIWNSKSMYDLWRQHHMMALTQLQICNLKN